MILVQPILAGNYQILLKTKIKIYLPEICITKLKIQYQDLPCHSQMSPWHQIQESGNKIFQLTENLTILSFIALVHTKNKGFLCKTGDKYLKPWGGPE